MFIDEGSMLPDIDSMVVLIVIPLFRFLRGENPAFRKYFF